MKFNKCIGITIAVVMTLTTLLSGCESSNANKTEKTGAEKQTTSNVKAKKGKISVTIYDRNEYTGASEGTIEDNKWTKWINEHAPVEVKFVAVPRWESQQKLNLLFATNEAPDLIMEYDNTYRNQLYSQKLIQPIDEAVEKYSTKYKDLLKEYSMLKAAGTKPDGKLYDMGRVSFMDTNHTALIRGDWLKKLNLEVPKTTEDLYNVIKAFVDKDPDGNGAKDTYGINLSGAAPSLFNHMFGINVIGRTLFKGWLVGGKVVGPQYDRIKSSLEFQKRLFDEGLVDKDFLTDKNGDKAKQAWLTGKMGIFFKSGAHTDVKSLRTNNANAEVIPLQLPKSSYGQFAPITGAPIQLISSVNANAKDLESIMKYIDFMLEEKTHIALNFGLEGEHYTLDADKNFLITDADKFNTDRKGCADMAMMCSPVILGGRERAVNKNDPIDVEELTVKNEIKRTYLTKGVKVPEGILMDYAPALSKELLLPANEGEKQFSDIFLKAIVGGASYTSDKAIEDIKTVFEKSEGNKIVEFYRKAFDDKTFDKTFEEFYKFPVSIK